MFDHFCHFFMSLLTLFKFFGSRKLARFCPLEKIAFWFINFDGSRGVLYVNLTKDNKSVRELRTRNYPRKVWEPRSDMITKRGNRRDQKLAIQFHHYRQMNTCAAFSIIHAHSRWNPLLTSQHAKGGEAKCNSIVIALILSEKVTDFKVKVSNKVDFFAIRLCEGSIHNSTFKCEFLWELFIADSLRSR